MIEVTSDAAAVSIGYAEAPRLVSSTIVKVLTKIGAGLVSWVKTRKLTGQILQRRTGSLSRAIFSRLGLDGQSAVLYLGADASKAPGARVQEYGGDIHAKRSKFLTIPVGKNLTGNGVMRVSPREFIANPSALGFASSFVNRRRTAIMGVTRGGRAEPVFALKTSVKVPERSYLRSTITDRRDWILDELGVATGEAIQSAVGGGGHGSAISVTVPTSGQ